MRSSIRQRCSAAALILAAGLYSTASLADTSAKPSGAESRAEQQQIPPAASRGHLGVKVQSIDEDTAAALGLADAKGALVTEVMPDGPAAVAGLKPYDTILAINGEAFSDGRELARKISSQAPTSSVDLKIKRTDGELTIKVKLGVLAAPAKEASTGDAAMPADNNDRPKLGLKLSNGASAEGVLIAEVVANSDAERKGLVTGDLILEVDGKAVSSPDEVIDSVKALQSKGRTAVLLLVKSGVETRAVPVRFSVVG